VRKIPLDGGFSCPNRDGVLGTSGCAFCHVDSFTPRRRPVSTIRDQMAAGMAKVRSEGMRFAAYFQPHTNTYGDADRLRAAYAEALAHPDVVSLCIGTRPDCVTPDLLAMIRDVAGDREVWMEYGLQSSKEATLRRLGRGHGWQDFVQAAAWTAELGLRAAAHVILGLPGETGEDEHRTALDLAGLPVSGVKIHNLYVARSTPLEAWHARGEAPPPDRETHAQGVVDFLERTRPDVVVHRLMSDPVREHLVAPLPYWDKAGFLQRVEAIFRNRGSRQGSRV
jgi:radical SAM protein (TIGR01212 family)